MYYQDTYVLVHLIYYHDLFYSIWIKSLHLSMCACLSWSRRALNHLFSKLQNCNWVGEHIFFGSLFNVRAMLNRCCDWWDKIRPREGDFGFWLIFAPWFLIRQRLRGYCITAIPSVRFRSNSFTIRRPSPMLVWKKPTPDSDAVPEYPLQLGCQTVALQDPPGISRTRVNMADSITAVVFKWAISSFLHCLG